MKKNLSLLLIVFAVMYCDINAQRTLITPWESQKAVVSQTVGLTDITVEYHRPAVKGREIWGKIVPFNKVWRAGANDNTTIEFTSDVTISGNLVPAGKYGVHIIPTEKEWTIILSKNYWSWGSFFYREKDDQLRFKVIPEACSFTEYMEFSFPVVTANSATLKLSWEKLSISFPIEVDVHNVVLASFRKQLDHLPGFGWQAWNQAASYCLRNKINSDEGLQWVDKSIGINKNFTNLQTKAGLLELKGDKSGAEKLIKEALAIATEAEINTLGYQYLQSGNVQKAIEIFQMNVKNHPSSWNVYDSLAEAYLTAGDKKSAKENYQKAYDMVTDEAQKQRIKDILEGIK